MKLAISAGFMLPLEAATETFAILGRRGSGKTHTAVVMAEEMLGAGVHVVVLDPLDVWWGLRVSKDGKSAGIPIYVAGGTHADIPLVGDAGKVLADVIVDKGLSVVLSLRHLSKADQRRFVGDFGERLYDRKGEDRHRTALHLFIDEADAFVPQRLLPGGERAYGAIDTLVRRGRSSGVAPTLISQRPQVISKDVLSQTEVLICHQLTGPQDRKALEAWIEAHDTSNQRETFMASLASLPRGTAWFWSPGLLDVFRKVLVRDRYTFDSSATPKAGGGVAAKPKAFAPVDLNALTSEIQATIEKAKADDPRELRKTIAELKKQLQSQVTSHKSEVRSQKIIERSILKDGHVARLEKLAERIGELQAGFIERMRQVYEPLTAQVADILNQIRRTHATPAPGVVSRPSVSAAPSRVRPHAADRNRPPRPQPAAEDNGYLPPGEKATLIAAAQYADGITREQASILTGYKRSSRDAYIQRLLGKDYVALVSGQVVATDAGVTALGSDYAPLPTGEALQQYWLQRLPPGEKAVLQKLLQWYPHAVDREAIDQETGYRRSSRDAYIQRLKARQLVTLEGRGAIRASDGLFDEEVIR